MADGAGDEPLVMWSEAVRAYDFGPGHPLTPRRFGPGIDLVQAAGATRFEAPPEATDQELERLHASAYVREIRAQGDHLDLPPSMGVGVSGDCPPFLGMHEASACIAGGSIAGMRAILDGRATRVFNPGGGLHHAMAARASGFCIYNDVALAVAVARDAGHRVLYVDLDVHHGDGTQAMFAQDPDAVTVSIHESGQTLFPGTGWVEEEGGPGAEASVVNVPLEAWSGDASWLDAVGSVVPMVAERAAPTMLVTQHGCDSHAYDPLAHLRLTTAAYAQALTLLDGISRRWCEGRWLATGGGGYDAYRVVPRSWALVWLAQAGRAVPASTPAEWRERWEPEAVRFRQAPLPIGYLDPPGLAAPEPDGATARDRRTIERVVERIERG